MMHELIDLHPRFEDFRREALAGLMQKRKRISPKYFYDAQGSALFEQICQTAEYYPTRTEMKILREQGPKIAARLGTGISLVEFGSGASKKTRILLDAMTDPAAYIPIDISKRFLLEASGALSREMPEIPICPVTADYMESMESLQRALAGYAHKAAFFPGSTIGNLDPEEALGFLTRLAGFLRHDEGSGKFLVGFDLLKPIEVLEAAYNDAEGRTAAFNLNLLERMNRELGAEFDLSKFCHHAFFNLSDQRIEMHLVSLEDQFVEVGGVPIHFGAEETIHTENSYKYSLRRFVELANTAGFSLVDCWTDEQRYFCVALLEAQGRQGLPDAPPEIAA